MYYVCMYVCILEAGFHCARLNHQKLDLYQPGFQLTECPELKVWTTTPSQILISVFVFILVSVYDWDSQVSDFGN